MDKDIKNVIDSLNNGGVGLLPTDTLYGLVARAMDRDAVNRVYKLKNRSDNKPFIILVSSLTDLNKLSIELSPNVSEFIQRVWPGPVSVILPCVDEKLAYLHKGMSLAIRWPNNKILEDIIKHTGPLVAPSANPEGLKPATNIDDAKTYFGDSVDFYLDDGDLSGEPSTLVSIVDDSIQIIRQGRGKVLPT